MADSFSGDVADNAGTGAGGVATGIANARTDAGSELSRILDPRSASRAETANAATLDVVRAPAIHDTVPEVDADVIEVQEGVDTEDVVPMRVE